MKECVAEKGWDISRSKTHFKDPHLSVATVEISSPHRARSREWTVVYRKRAVVVAPMTKEGNLILIRQERIPIQKTIWEMPAGQIDDSSQEDDEAIGKIALKELREETGFELADNGQLISLGPFFSSPGFTDEEAHLFLARPVQASANGNAPEESESILDCREFPASEIASMIAANEIVDANTLSVFAKLVVRGFLSLPKS